MSTIPYGTKTIAYRIKRTGRKKTVAIHMQPDATVVILTPRFLEDNRIKEIVLRRARWIIQKQETLKKLKTALPKKEFVSGEAFLYLGRQYRLKVIKTDNNSVADCKLLNGRLEVEIDKQLKGHAAQTAVYEKLLQWYRKHAHEKVVERVEKYSQLTVGKPKKIVIRDQTTRWGSCSRSGIIRFNWKIIMAPLSIVDYVVVHELCHLLVPNHSKMFWDKVRVIVPDSRKKIEWLREHSQLLTDVLTP